MKITKNDSNRFTVVAYINNRLIRRVFQFSELNNEFENIRNIFDLAVNSKSLYFGDHSELLESRILLIKADDSNRYATDEDKKLAIQDIKSNIFEIITSNLSASVEECEKMDAMEFNNFDQYTTFYLDPYQCSLDDEKLMAKNQQYTMYFNETEKILISFFREKSKFGLPGFYTKDLVEQILGENNDEISQKKAFMGWIEGMVKLNNNWEEFQDYYSINGPQSIDQNTSQDSNTVYEAPDYKPYLEDLSSIEKSVESLTNIDLILIDFDLEDLVKIDVSNINELKVAIDTVTTLLGNGDKNKGVELYKNTFQTLNDNINKKPIIDLAKNSDQSRSVFRPVNNLITIAKLLSEVDISVSDELKAEYALALCMFQDYRPKLLTFPIFLRLNAARKALLPLTTNTISHAILDTSFMLGARSLHNKEKLESYLTVIDNLVQISSTKPELYSELSKLLLDRKTPRTKEMLENYRYHELEYISLLESFLFDFETSPGHKHILRFLTTKDAVLLPSNTIEALSYNPIISADLKPHTTVGEVAFAGSLITSNNPLRKDSISSILPSEFKTKKIAEINKRYNTLSQSQLSEDAIYTVIRELFQNAKDASYGVDHVVDISLDQDLVSGIENIDLGLEKDKEYLHTRFSDNATGVPDFIMNYFNPLKSTKNSADTAGGFGCGAITINSICDVYEINHKEEGKDAQRIRIKVIKDINGKVIDTEVLSLETSDRKTVGYSIDMYEEVKEGEVPEIKSMIAGSTLAEISELELINNLNQDGSCKINLSIQGQSMELNPSIKVLLENDEIQLVKGVKPGLWVKNLHIRDYNRSESDDVFKLPEFIQTMLNEKDNVSVNFKTKKEVVRSRNGFSESGENSAKLSIYKNYIQSLASRIFDGDTVDIPGIDNELGRGYIKYSNSKIQTIATKLQNGEIDDASIFDDFSNRDWVTLIMNTKFENDGQSNSLVEYFRTLEKLKNIESSKSNLAKTNNSSIIEEALKTMTTEEQLLFAKLQNSGASKTYPTLDTQYFLGHRLNREQRKNSETLLNNAEADALMTTPNMRRNKKMFESIFKELTDSLPNDYYQKVDFQLQWVSRTAGPDYAGSLDGNTGLYVCKYNITNIQDLDLNSNTDSNYKSMYEAIIHELSHHTDYLTRMGGGHDEIFSKFIELNYARLLSKI